MDHLDFIKINLSKLLKTFQDVGENGEFKPSKDQMEKYLFSEFTIQKWIDALSYGAFI